MPHASGDEDERFVKVLSASDVDALLRFEAVGGRRYHAKDIVHTHDSNMVPTSRPRSSPLLPQRGMRRPVRKLWERQGDCWTQRYNFSGRYGANLMEEVARYAVVAAQVARNLEGSST